MHTKSAFSLVELMVAVGIIGVLVSIAWPRYKSFIANTRRGEAKSNLAHIISLQEAYKIDHFHYYNAAPLSVNGIGYKDGKGMEGQNDCDADKEVDKGTCNHLGFDPEGLGELRYLYQVRDGGQTAVASAASDDKGKYVYPDCNGAGSSECGYSYGDAVMQKVKSRTQVCRNITKYCPFGVAAPPPPCGTNQCCDSGGNVVAQPPGLTCNAWQGTWDGTNASCCITIGDACSSTAHQCCDGHTEITSVNQCPDPVNYTLEPFPYCCQPITCSSTTHCCAGNTEVPRADVCTGDWKGTWVSSYTNCCACDSTAQCCDSSGNVVPRPPGLTCHDWVGKWDGHNDSCCVPSVTFPCVPDDDTCCDGPAEVTRPSTCPTPRSWGGAWDGTDASCCGPTNTTCPANTCCDDQGTPETSDDTVRTSDADCDAGQTLQPYPICCQGNCSADDCCHHITNTVMPKPPICTGGWKGTWVNDYTDCCITCDINTQCCDDNTVKPQPTSCTGDWKGTWPNCCATCDPTTECCDGNTAQPKPDGLTCQGWFGTYDARESRQFVTYGCCQNCLTKADGTPFTKPDGTTVTKQSKYYHVAGIGCECDEDRDYIFGWPEGQLTNRQGECVCRNQHYEAPQGFTGNYDTLGQINNSTPRDENTFCKKCPDGRNLRQLSSSSSVRWQWGCVECGLEDLLRKQDLGHPTKVGRGNVGSECFCAADEVQTDAICGDKLCPGGARKSVAATTNISSLLGGHGSTVTNAQYTSLDFSNWYITLWHWWSANKNKLGTGEPFAGNDTDGNGTNESHIIGTTDYKYWVAQVWNNYLTQYRAVRQYNKGKTNPADHISYPPIPNNWKNHYSTRRSSMTGTLTSPTTLADNSGLRFITCTVADMIK